MFSSETEYYYWEEEMDFEPINFINDLLENYKTNEPKIEPLEWKNFQNFDSDLNIKKMIKHHKKRGKQIDYFYFENKIEIIISTYKIKELIENFSTLFNLKFSREEKRNKNKLIEKILNSWNIEKSKIFYHYFENIRLNTIRLYKLNFKKKKKKNKTF